MRACARVRVHACVCACVCESFKGISATIPIPDPSELKKVQNTEKNKTVLLEK